MSVLKGSPEQLLRCALVFKRSCNDSQQLMQRLNTLVQGLQSEWQGPAYQGFLQGHQQLSSMLMHSAAALDALGGSLQAAANQLTEAERGGLGGGGSSGRGSGGASRGIAFPEPSDEPHSFDDNEPASGSGGGGAAGAAGSDVQPEPVHAPMETQATPEPAGVASQTPPVEAILQPVDSAPSPAVQTPPITAPETIEVGLEVQSAAPESQTIVIEAEVVEMGSKDDPLVALAGDATTIVQSGAASLAGSTGGQWGAEAAQNAQIVAEVAKSKGLDPVTAVACMLVESRGDSRAMGDSGTSFGLFQLHRGGELGEMSPEQAYDPRTNAEVALSEFARNRASYADPGQLAAASQRPAEPEEYARKVDEMLPEARRILGLS